jgi:hypothetical protein
MNICKALALCLLVWNFRHSAVAAHVLEEDYQWLVGRWVVTEWKTKAEVGPNSLFRSLYEIHVYLPYLYAPRLDTAKPGFRSVAAEFLVSDASLSKGVAVHEDSGWVSISKDELHLGPEWPRFLFSYRRTTIRDQPHLTLQYGPEEVVLVKSNRKLGKPLRGSLTMPVGFEDKSAMEDLAREWREYRVPPPQGTGGKNTTPRENGP